MTDLLLPDHSRILSVHVISVVLTVRLHVLDQLGDTEEVVHLLERQALGLGDKEPDEDEHGEAEGAVGEEGAVAALTHGGHHVGGCARDDEVEEPLWGFVSMYICVEREGVGLWLGRTCVAAAMATLRERRRAAGISET